MSRGGGGDLSERMRSERSKPSGQTQLVSRRAVKETVLVSIASGRMISPKSKQRGPDADPPGTGQSGISLDFFDSDSMKEMMSAWRSSPTNNPLIDSESMIEEEGVNCHIDTGSDQFETRPWSSQDTNSQGVAELQAISQSSDGLFPNAGVKNYSPPLPFPSNMVPVMGVSTAAMAATTTATHPPSGTDNGAIATSYEITPQGPSATTPYELVDGKIVLANPDVVKAPVRIKIFTELFGDTNPDGGAWTRYDIGSRFADLCGHGRTCLVPNSRIKSGSGYHCKGPGVTPCGPCKVFKVLKQIGSNLQKKHTGGIPRMILDIAKILNLNSTVDYRDLRLIFEALTELGDDMSSCTELWAICLEDATTYIDANKRFYGCLMAMNHRPMSDSINHAGSKGLANLWDRNDIWKGGKYLKFTQTTRYNDSVSKIEERSYYRADVIVNSIKHVNRRNPAWKTLAEKCWNELKKARERHFKKSGRKRKMMEEEEEFEDDTSFLQVMSAS